MGRRTRKKLLVLRTSAAHGRPVRTVARWAHTLVPAAVLVVMPLEGARTEVDEDAIVLDADEVASGPLSLAHAMARAVAGSSAGAGTLTAPPWTRQAGMVSAIYMGASRRATQGPPGQTTVEGEP